MSPLLRVLLALLIGPAALFALGLLWNTAAADGGVPVAPQAQVGTPSPKTVAVPQGPVLPERAATTDLQVQSEAVQGAAAPTPVLPLAPQKPLLSAVINDQDFGGY